MNKGLRIDQVIVTCKWLLHRGLKVLIDSYLGL